MYVATANRGVQWQDSGYFILRTVTGEAVNPLGLALTHPLHYWLSRFAIRIGLLEPALAVTLVSSVAAAVAVANLFGCVASLTGDRMAAALVAATLSVANTFWQLATIAETYTLGAALMTAQCWCVISLIRPMLEPEAGDQPSNPYASLRKLTWLFLAIWFLNGLSIANHNLALLTIPMLLVASLWMFVRRVISWRAIFLAICVWILGSSPYVALVVQEGIRSENWNDTIRSALFGHGFKDRVLNASLSGQLSLIAVYFVLLNFPNLFLPAAVSGFRAGWKHPKYSWLFRLLFLGLIVHALFAFRYPVSDQHYFFLPTYIFLSLYAGLGFHQWLKRRRGLLLPAWMLIAATPVMYALLPIVLPRFDALGYMRRNKPYRDDYRYLFVPWSVAEKSADRMSKEALALAGDAGVIVVEDRMAEFAVKYQVFRSGKHAVQVMDDLDVATFQAAVAAGYPIVLVPADVNRFHTHPITGTWRRQGDLYILESD